VAHGGDQVAVVLALDQVREHFGIGLAREAMAFVDELRAQRRVILDDAVVHDGKRPRAIEVRVRVFVGGPTVRCPAGVADADVAVQRFAVRQALGESPELAFGLRPKQRAGIIDDGDPGGIVAAVFEPPQGVHDHRNAITRPDIANDAAHG
jgi:hypothetical protein